MTTSRQHSRLSSLAVLLPLIAPLVAGYKFSIAAEPAQCSNFTVHWDGGQGPYELLLVPVGHVTPEIRTIVDQRIDSGNSISLQLKFPEGSQFVASLSDASGVGAGGTSDVLTVKGGTSGCLTGPTQAGWVLYMDNPTPNQCSPTHISWDSNASGRVSMWGVIPGGDTFDMGAPSGSGWDWTPNLKEGTRMMIVAGDSKGRGTGGSTDVFSVGGGSGSCISNNSPSTTEGPAAGQITALETSHTTFSAGPTSTSGSNGSTGNSGDGKGNDGKPDDGTNNSNNGSNDDENANATPQSDPNGASSKSMHGGTIAGLVAGILGGLLLALLCLFLLRRSRRRQADEDSFTNMRGRGNLLSSGAPSIAESGGMDSVRVHAPHENVPRDYAATPFVMRPRGGAYDPAAFGATSLGHSQSGYTAEDFSDSGSTNLGHRGFAAGGATTETDYSDVQLLAPSPLPTPSHEKHAYLNPFADHHAVVAVPLNRTPSDSPPSFKTRATRGHSGDDAETDRSGSPTSIRRPGPPLTLMPHAELSSWTLGDVEGPPSYVKDTPTRDGFQPDPQGRFIHFGGKTSSSGHP